MIFNREINVSDRQIRLMAPVIFWALIFLVKMIRVFPFYEGPSLTEHLETIVITTSLELIPFCLFYFYLIPQLFSKGRMFWYAVLLSVLFLASFGFVWGWVYYYRGVVTSHQEQMVIYKASLGHNILSVLYAFVLGFTVEWLEQFRKQKEITEKQIRSELALLRSQINPHFLFNTLNNINSFSGSNPEKTSFAIIKLSEIMRYMLYDARDELVPLEKEIAYIRNYLSLQRLRFRNPEFVKCDISDETGHVMVPPLLFITFIENAFKHGKTSMTNSIGIKLRVTQSTIHFDCMNHIRNKSNTEEQAEGGIGIENTKRRLELLFPKRHQLLIENDGQVFHVQLKIRLNEN
ncbi:sensor histidine kinase [Prolixibacter bellariivorans]|nr:histidine kinase [Prolixibacter bellariivorans]